MEEINFSTLIENKTSLGEKITYSDKLQTIEWKQKRGVIISRDNNICTECKALPTITEFGIHKRANTPEEQKEYVNKVNEMYRESGLEMIRPYLGSQTPEILSDISLGFKTVVKPTILHVHHKYYIQGFLPWEYPNDALITLCQTCHQAIHDTTEIPVYEDEKMNTTLKLTKCSRCNGSGYLKKYDYYLNGICLRCDGNKYDELM